MNYLLLWETPWITENCISCFQSTIPLYIFVTVTLYVRAARLTECQSKTTIMWQILIGNIDDSAVWKLGRSAFHTDTCVPLSRKENLFSAAIG